MSYIINYRQNIESSTPSCKRLLEYVDNQLLDISVKNINCWHVVTRGTKNYAKRHMSYDKDKAASSFSQNV